MVRLSSPVALCSCSIIATAKQCELIGLDVPAAVLARVGLERHLKILCRWWGIGPRSRKSQLHVCAHKLLDKRYINRAEWMAIKLVVKVGNKAAHGDSVTWAETHEAIEFAERFIADHHVNEDFLRQWEEGTHPFLQDDDDDDAAEAWKGGDA